MLTLLFKARTVMGIVRHIVTLGAGVLIAYGLISAEDAQTLIGAVMAVAGIAASVKDKA